MLIPPLTPKEWKQTDMPKSWPNKGLTLRGPQAEAFLFEGTEREWKGAL